MCGRGEPVPTAEFQCRLLSLPRYFNTTVETIPHDIPYIRADAKAVSDVSQQLGPKPALRVGLVWAGKCRPDAIHRRIDQRRSFELSVYEPLFDVSGVQFFSLQKGVSIATASGATKRPRLVDYPADARDFFDIVPLMANLDLIISVDTSVPHLAGAMGKPVWLLSRYDGCWRWLINREDSPWYPTMRIFHQPSPGDWGSVIDRVRGALETLVNRAATNVSTAEHVIRDTDGQA